MGGCVGLALRARAGETELAKEFVKRIVWVDLRATALAGSGATMGVEGVTARAWCPLMRPAPVAPTAPAATRARIRRRGVDASVLFMVSAFSIRVAMEGSVGTDT